ncbi:MAG: glycosyltransferase [Vicinamibacterales bacterium]
MTSKSLTELPEVAVCLAAFNGIRWLPQQLDSILEQRGVSVTVVVSVDRSTDGTEQWVAERAAGDSRIVALPYGGRFGGAALNFFRLLRDTDFSGFDYVSFSDQDDIWQQEKLLRAHRVLQETGGDGYSSDVLAFWPSGRTRLIRKSQPQRRWDFHFEAAGPGCTYVMRAHLARAIQGLVRQRWEEICAVGLHDWFVYAFARANGYRWVIDRHAEVLYRQHDRNHLGVNAGRRAFAYRVRSVTSGWAFAQAELIANLVGARESEFVKRWLEGGRSGFLWLALNSSHCRRRVRDRLLFALSCLVSFTAGIRPGARRTTPQDPAPLFEGGWSGKPR